MNKPDPRREIRVFLASSEELEEERGTFAAVLRKINERPDLARNYVLKAVRWETDAFGFSPDINRTIQSTVEFERLHVVLILLWNRLGKGTLQEYEAALPLERFRGRPRLAVYVREPSPEAEPEDLAAIRAFKERVIADGGVPTTYTTPEDLWDRLRTHLPELLPQVEADEPSTPARLRSLFLGSALANVLLSAVTLVIASLMAAPGWNTNYFNLLFILFAPPLIFLGFSFSLWSYHRLLGSLKSLWRSPRFDDQELYETFRSTVPRFAIHDRLKRQFPRLLGSQLLQAVILTLAFLVPGVAQYQALYQEILLWNYVVGWDTVEEGEDEFRGRCMDDEPVPGCVESRYVDCARRQPWTFGLRDEAVRRVFEERGAPVIYVHAHCRFARDADLPPRDFFRRNLGPEIFLPWQPRIYFTLIVLTVIGILATAWRLVRFPRELDPPE